MERFGSLRGKKQQQSFFIWFPIFYSFLLQYIMKHSCNFKHVCFSAGSWENTQHLFILPDWVDIVVADHLWRRGLTFASCVPTSNYLLCFWFSHDRKELALLHRGSGVVYKRAWTRQMYNKHRYTSCCSKSNVFNTSCHLILREEVCCTKGVFQLFSHKHTCLCSLFLETSDNFTKEKSQKCPKLKRKELVWPW